MGFINYADFQIYITKNTKTQFGYVSLEWGKRYGVFDLRGSVVMGDLKQIRTLSLKSLIIA
jgi:hypothetical protein